MRFLLSLRNVEDLLHERGIEITHETARFWWSRFGTILAAEIPRSRVQAIRSFRHREIECLEGRVRGRLLTGRFWSGNWENQRSFIGPKTGIAAAAAEQPDLADCGRKPIKSLGG